MTKPTGDCPKGSILMRGRAARGMRTGLVLLALASALAACATNDTTDTIRINKEQGTEENISSLTAVIESNPTDPEGYNTRGSAYGRAGEFRRALDDFNKALELNPRFYQAYANRGLIYRNMGQPEQALQDYNTALKLSPRNQNLKLATGLGTRLLLVHFPNRVSAGHATDFVVPEFAIPDAQLEIRNGIHVQVLVRDNNVDQALRALKKKMQREGIFREMKMRDYYEKPSQKRAREKAEAVRRVRKLARKRAQREGMVSGSRPAAAR